MNTLIYQIIAGVCVIVLATFVTGTVVYVLRRQEKDTAEVKESSSVGDNTLGDKIEALRTQTQSWRSEDKIWSVDEMKKIRADIEKRRLDDKEIFGILNSLSVQMGKVRTHIKYLVRKRFLKDDE